MSEKLEFKGTKGEWKVNECLTNGVKGYEIHYSNDGECITDHVYVLQDAKLIAAAPHLLKELQKIKLDIDLGTIHVRKESPIYRGIVEVIEKALK